jgi:hypothetical protein
LFTDASAGDGIDKLSSLLDAVAAADLKLTVVSVDPVSDKSGEDAADAVTDQTETVVTAKTKKP